MQTFCLDVGGQSFTFFDTAKLLLEIILSSFFLFCGVSSFVLEILLAAEIFDIFDIFDYLGFFVPNKDLSLLFLLIFDILDYLAWLFPNKDLSLLLLLIFDVPRRFVLFLADYFLGFDLFVLELSLILLFLESLIRTLESFFLLLADYFFLLRRDYLFKMDFFLSP